MGVIQKLIGPLTLGPARHDKSAEIYNYIRVGGVFLKNVKIPGVLATLLLNGMACTLWVATIRTPTPFLFQTNIYVVYAVGVGGKVYKAVDEVKRGWTGAKWLTVISFVGVGFVTMPLLGLGLLFWINAVRLPFADLPIDEMRREPG